MKNGDGFVKLRKKGKVLRYKRYKKEKDSQNYFRVELMLYLSWINEQKEIEVKDTFEKFTQNKEVIILNKSRFESVFAIS